MSVHKSGIRHAMVMARIAAIVVAFVLSHDVMMALAPHDAGTELARHEIVTIEQCSSTEGIAHGFFGPPVEHPDANRTDAGLHLAIDFAAIQLMQPAIAGLDASARRAWLQVFLN